MPREASQLHSVEGAGRVDLRRVSLSRRSARDTLEPEISAAELEHGRVAGGCEHDDRDRRHQDLPPGGSLGDEQRQRIEAESSHPHDHGDTMCESGESEDRAGDDDEGASTTPQGVHADHERSTGNEAPDVLGPEDAEVLGELARHGQPPRQDEEERRDEEGEGPQAELAAKGEENRRQAGRRHDENRPHPHERGRS